MKTRKQLEKEALKAATDRGHKLSYFAAYVNDRSKSEAGCLNCECWALVNAKPQPNQSGIGGTAVATNCDAEKGSDETL
jgi:hypothetical protein